MGVKLLVSDCDGTLLTPDKRVSDRSVRALLSLRDAGIEFAVASGRPPLGMSDIVRQAGVTTPVAAFNGGMVVEPADMSMISHTIMLAPLVASVTHALGWHGLDVWAYAGRSWHVPRADAPYVEWESKCVGFHPEVYADVADIEHIPGVSKLVGVTEDPFIMNRAQAELRRRYGHRVSATPSTEFYLDVTPHSANKGTFTSWLAKRYGLDTSEVATIGDSANDVLMFAHSGLSIAMGNASKEVQHAAQRVTYSNDHEGFAYAVERFILDEQR